MKHSRTVIVKRRPLSIIVAMAFMLSLISTVPSTDLLAMTTVTVSFQDGVSPSVNYAGTRDASMAEITPSTSQGTSNVCGADGDDPGGSDLDFNSLLRWDITTIPPGSTVSSATITLKVTNRSPQTYELYQIMKDWIESEVTWDAYASGTNWQVGGANGALDRGTLVLGSINANSKGIFGITLNVDGVALMQSWIDSPTTNNGLVMADSSNSNGLDFDCREAGTPANRPKLTIAYIPPNEN